MAKINKQKTRFFPCKINHNVTKSFKMMNIEM